MCTCDSRCVCNAMHGCLWYNGQQIVLLQVLMAWRSNLTCDTVKEAKQQLAGALKSVGLARKAKQITRGSQGKFSIIATVCTLITLHDIIDTALQTETETDGPPTQRAWRPLHEHIRLPNIKKSTSCNVADLE